jgi:hypothetical protein
MSQSFSPPMPKTVVSTTTSPARPGPAHHSPFRLAVSATPWRSAWYLIGQALGGAVFAALAHVVRDWRDPAARRELGRASGLWLPLAILDTVVLSVWGWFAGMITLPVFIDTLPKALLAAAIGLAGFIVSSYALVATARANNRANSR